MGTPSASWQITPKKEFNPLFKKKRLMEIKRMAIQQEAKELIKVRCG